jgi:hypothetical protein
LIIAHHARLYREPRTPYLPQVSLRFLIGLMVAWGVVAALFAPASN